MPTTDLTETGYRVLTEVHPSGMVILTCQSEALSLNKEGVVHRHPWVLSQLGVPYGIPRSEAEKLVTYWLSFYGGVGLAQSGLESFRKEFCGIQEVQEQPTSTSQGMN